MECRKYWVMSTSLHCQFGCLAVLTDLRSAAALCCFWHGNLHGLNSDSKYLLLTPTVTVTWQIKVYVVVVIFFLACQFLTRLVAPQIISVSCS